MTKTTLSSKKNPTLSAFKFSKGSFTPRMSRHIMLV